MAAPATAGAAALVREYFMKGYYTETGGPVPNLANGFTPSGALVKAIIIHSGKPLLYQILSSGTQIPLAYPSVDQGYGKPLLFAFRNVTFILQCK